MWSVVIYFLSVATFLLNLSGLRLFQLLIFCILSNYFSGVCDGEWWQVFCLYWEKVRGKREKRQSVVPICSNYKKAEEYFVLYMLPRTDPQRCSLWLHNLFTDIKQSHFHPSGKNMIFIQAFWYTTSIKHEKTVVGEYHFFTKVQVPRSLGLHFGLFCV